MKVVIASGGRFHAVHLMQQLAKKKMLHTFFTWAALSFTEKNSHIVSSQLASFTEKILEKTVLGTILPFPTYYAYKDELFDRWLCNYLKKTSLSYDLFVGWAGYCLGALEKARQAGAVSVLEVGSMHILDQQEIIEAENCKNNFSLPQIHKHTTKKILEEYETSDFIMVPSSHVAHSFEKHGIKKEKVKIVPYGVDLSFFNPKKKIPSSFKALFVGRITPLKGVDFLLESWRLFEKMYPKKGALHLVGSIDPIMKNSISKNSFSSIHFHPACPQKDLALWYQSSSVLILPSLQEGMAMVQVESLACATPVIGTERTGIVDIVSQEEGGFVAPSGSIEELFYLIEWCFKHQEECFERGQKGALKVSCHSWNFYGDKITDMYEKLLKEKRNEKSCSNNRN